METLIFLKENVYQLVRQIYIVMLLQDYASLHVLSTQATKLTKTQQQGVAKQYAPSTH